MTPIIGLNPAFLGAAGTTASVLLQTFPDEEGSGGTNGSGVQGSGNEFATGASLLGNTITKVIIPLSKTGSPPGNLEVGIWESSTDTLRLSLGIVTATSLQTGTTDETFENLTGYVMTADDVIGVQYKLGDGSNRIDFRRTNASDDANVGQSTYNGSSWGTPGTKELSMQIFGS